MTQKTHTPGPWSVHPMTNLKISTVDDFEDGVSWDFAECCIGHGLTQVATVRYQTSALGYPAVKSYGEFLANSRLILAAPEMLAALEQAAFAMESAVMLRGMEMFVPAVESARAAITRARKGELV